MANTLSAIKGRGYERFLTTIGDHRDDLAGWVDILTQDVANLSLSTWDGVSAFTEQTNGDDPSATDIAGYGNVVTPVTYEKLLKISLQDMRDNPELANEASARLANAAIAKMVSLYCTTFGALDTTEHPLDGTLTAVGAGTVYCVDNFATPVAQQNFGETALSDASFAAGIKTIRNWKNRAGQFVNFNLDMGTVHLVVGPAMEAAAKQLASVGAVWDGTDLQLGQANAMGVKVSSTPYLSDVNDWFIVVGPQANGCKLWIRKAPTLRITQGEKTGHFYFYADTLGAVALSPEVDYGIYQGKVG